jgi:hypothetical protein
MTVSFKNIEDIERTPISTLESTRGKDGYKIPIDPIEYKIKDLSLIDAVKLVIKERIEPLVNMTFEFIDEGGDCDFETCGVVRIGFQKNKGCWALLGMDQFFSKDKTTVNFEWLDAATIMHEMGHVIGMIHEHQLDIENPIEWNEEFVYEWAEETYGWDRDTTYTNILHKYDKEKINGIDFDPDSMMLYFFPKEMTMNGVGTNQNLRLSIEDMKFIMSVMPGKTNDYKKFYKEFYGVDILDGLSSNIIDNNDNNDNNDIYMWIFALFGFGLFVAMIFLFLIKKGKTNNF